MIFETFDLKEDTFILLQMIFDDFDLKQGTLYIHL